MIRKCSTKNKMGVQHPLHLCGHRLVDPSKMNTCESIIFLIIIVSVIINIIIITIVVITTLIVIVVIVIVH